MTSFAVTSASIDAERRALRPTQHPVRYIVIGVIGLILVVLFGLFVKHDASWSAAEMKLDSWFAAHRNGFGTVIAAFIDKLFGPAGAVIDGLVFAIIVRLVTKSWWRALVALVIVLGCWVPVVPISEIVHRMRPGLDSGIVISAKTYSYPSGHSAYVTALTIATWFTLRDHRIRRFVIVCGIVLLLIVGWSRVYLGLHYPTDVLAGFATAVLAACIGIPLLVNWVVPWLMRVLGRGRGRRRAGV
jgi:membrane-associated phospholipid phosphatase